MTGYYSKFVQDPSVRNSSRGSQPSEDSTHELLVKLLGKLNTESPPVAQNNVSHTMPTSSIHPVMYATPITPPTYNANGPQLTPLVQPIPNTQPPPGFSYQAQPTYYAYKASTPAQPTSQVGLAFGPIQYSAQPTAPTGPSIQPTFAAQPGSLGCTVTPGQATILPHAFTVGTLHDPVTGAWNMDTGASSHLNNSVTSLSENFNTCMYPSISVGDGHSIPVTNTGHSILPTPFKSLHLNNVLITPHIVKNLIYVRQFVRDNNCTIEFDAFGFSVKDFMTRRVLLRCDSTGDLYPVTAPSPIPHVFLVSQHTWHQRLGHPGREVLRHLVSNNFISCNKEKPLVLCHACQLGKHVRLPFVSSNTVVTSCFDIIHSDVWTSPIPSLSGFKYYVLFLDHYSQFVWVYHLLNKF
ncbi:ribonuclease H-like domain-containing protein [Tanacetum coccineum]